eukprot:COSAG05_NODE_4068_length_1688_cov_9.620593_3_plen_66_part_00
MRQDCSHSGLRRMSARVVSEVAAHEEQKMLQIEDAEQLEQAADSLSDDDLEGVPLAGNWCTDGDY